MVPAGHARRCRSQPWLQQRHRFPAVGDLADRVAVQARLHCQLPGMGGVPWGVVPCCDGETDLVVELRRCRYVAFLLDMESHAGGTGRNAVTIRT